MIQDVPFPDCLSALHCLPHNCKGTGVSECVYPYLHVMHVPHVEETNTIHFSHRWLGFALARRSVSAALS